MPTRPLIECEELTRLLAESTRLFAEYQALSDEANLKPKNDQSLAQKRRYLKNSPATQRRSQIISKPHQKSSMPVRKFKLRHYQTLGGGALPRLLHMV